MLKNIINPSSSDALVFIEEYHRSKPDKTLLILIGNCMVDYRGRARSLLDWGERVVMIKQDGTVLVHRPVMREPVNWQPSGAKTEFRVEENHLVIRSHHTRPPEKMKVTFIFSGGRAWRDLITSWFSSTRKSVFVSDGCQLTGSRITGR